MRTIPKITQQLQPLEDSIRNDFIPSLFKRKVSDSIRDLVALPARLGGMGIINPTKVAECEYSNSRKLTQPLTKMIIEQNDTGEIDEDKQFKVKQEISTEREAKQRRQYDDIVNRNNLTREELRRMKMNQEKGASNWLSSLPLRENGFSLNKQEFYDAVALRYGLPIENIPDMCVCGQNFSVDHAMRCKTGGYVAIRHNEVRDVTYEMMSEVCRDVEKEPQLLPITGEKLQYRTSNTNEDARCDIAARGFWSRGERAFFDIRVFDPAAPSYIDQDLGEVHKRHETEKIRSYEERIRNIEHGSFFPLVFTLAGGMGKIAEKCYSRLADMLAESRKQSRAVVIAWMRCRLSFSLLRSAILCIRGTRTRRPISRGLHEIDFRTVVAEGRISVPRGYVL